MHSNRHQRNITLSLPILIMNFMRPRHFSNRWWFKIIIPNQTKGTNWRPGILTLWSWITIRIGHSKVKILWKLVSCGLSNMISSHQTYTNYSSRQNSKEKLLWNSLTYITTSICVSMRWLDFENTSFRISSPPKYTLSLNNNSCYIFLNRPIIVNEHMYTLCWWYWLMTPV